MESTGKENIFYKNLTRQCVYEFDENDIALLEYRGRKEIRLNLAYFLQAVWKKDELGRWMDEGRT